jgi:hypothetical protein
MPAIRPRALDVLLLALAVATPAFAQPVAERPKIVVGDGWEFRETQSERKSSESTHVVTELLPDGAVRMRHSDQTVQEYDSALNWLPRGRRDYALVVQRFPLKVGDEWKVSRAFPNPSSSEVGKARVAAFEPVTVPAGTFQCYRIEVRTELATRKHSEARLLRRWYCPEVKWYAKEVIDVDATGKKGAVKHTTTTELVRFTPGR